ncbi:MAG: NUDIX hydrolase, partial [Pseudomonadota bacterium]
MSRDAVERAAIREGIGRAPNMRPKDASTLIILDGHGPKAKVLMGRRHERHKFMPGLFVFPGGRVDAGDGAVASADNLHPLVEEKLLSNLRGRPSQRRTRGIALAAIRETYEEAGLL